MYGLRFRHEVESIEHCAATPPSEAMVAAIDAALMFVTSRELLTQEQVVSVFAMLRIASPQWTEPGALCDALDGAAERFAARRLISAGELADRLLDLRLTVRAPVEDVSATLPATTGRYPLVCA